MSFARQWMLKCFMWKFRLCPDTSKQFLCQKVICKTKCIHKCSSSLMHLFICYNKFKYMLLFDNGGSGLSKYNFRLQYVQLCYYQSCEKMCHKNIIQSTIYLPTYDNNSWWTNYKIQCVHIIACCYTFEVVHHFSLMLLM